jgi:hypothetical protein
MALVPARHSAPLKSLGYVISQCGLSANVHRDVSGKFGRYRDAATQYFTDVPAGGKVRHCERRQGNRNNLCRTRYEAFRLIVRTNLLP